MNHAHLGASMLLTIRESEILQHIVSGKTSQQIAVILYISKETVDKHRKNMLKKAGVRNCALNDGKLGRFGNNHKWVFFQVKIPIYGYRLRLILELPLEWKNWMIRKINFTT